MKRRPGLRIVLGRVGLILLMTGTAFVYWKHVQYGITAIGEGNLYLSGAMPPEELQETVRRYGIKSVVDLRFTTARTEMERAAMQESGVRYHALPTPQVPTQETVDAYLKLLEDPANFPVLVHCHHGTGRTQLFGALYRIEVEGWSPDKARRATRLLPESSSFSEDRGKGRFLLEYKPRRKD
jgi:protein tyrosine phosphatase (PTP) superfamily phosphohydrolase (DUF442 family)